ncbi:hypothetical protein WN51_11000 [Melipona quadrifasciata]|uniref:Uncharacterized protein n=1 Tax=Melipona quadrifasciata TaxID=166423 RepID=A0A0N0U6Q8_9HYME|nr:hypothetical protein WN51_11000 [Melipona quadrifasciata]
MKFNCTAGFLHAFDNSALIPTKVPVSFSFAPSPLGESRKFSRIDRHENSYSGVCVVEFVAIRKWPKKKLKFLDISKRSSGLKRNLNGARYCGGTVGWIAEYIRVVRYSNNRDADNRDIDLNFRDNTFLSSPTENLKSASLTRSSILTKFLVILGFLDKEINKVKNSALKTLIKGSDYRVTVPSNERQLFTILENSSTSTTAANNRPGRWQTLADAIVADNYALVASLLACSSLFQLERVTNSSFVSIKIILDICSKH